MAMRRTTIMADEDLLERLRAIARRERISLAEVIRQGLEWRARRQPPKPSFIGAGASGAKGHPTGELAGEMQFEPRSWR